MAAIGESWAPDTWVATGGWAADTWGDFVVVTPVTARLVWSLPRDRNAGTAAARVATRQRATVGQESDVRLVFDAAGPRALAADLADMDLLCEVAKNTLLDPVLTSPADVAVTVVSATQCEVAFEVTTLNTLSPGTMVVSLYDVTTGKRTWLADVKLTASNTAFYP